LGWKHTQQTVQGKENVIRQAASNIPAASSSIAANCGGDGMTKPARRWWMKKTTLQCHVFTHGSGGQTGTDT